MAATDRGIKIPEFESEAQEARWWDEHKNLVKEARASKNITIRMPLADLERARQLSAKKGLAYQTFIKMLLHEALDREEKRPVA